MKILRISKSDLHSTTKVIAIGAIALELVLDAIALAAIVAERLRGNSLKASALHVFSTYVEFWKKVFMKTASYFNWLLMRISDLR